MTDLLGLVQSKTSLKRVAGTNGGEYAGACPKCGGTDRLRVQPYHDPPRWFCRQCNARWSDAPGFLMHMEGLNYRAALEKLGQPLPEKKHKAPDKTNLLQAPEITHLEQWASWIPKWQDRLSDDKSKQAWLKGRGIVNWENYKIGFTGNDKNLDLKYRNRITIPHYHEGKLTAIKARGFTKGLKYISFEGSHFYLPYNSDILNQPLPCAFTVETEIDARALQDLTGLDLFVAIPAGSNQDKQTGVWYCTSFRPYHAALFMLVKTPYCIIDNDDSGEAFGRAFCSFLRRAQVVRPPRGFKDCGAWLEEQGLVLWAAMKRALRYAS